MDRRLEKERKDMQEQLRKDVEALEREEQDRYERKLEAMRKEIS